MNTTLSHDLTDEEIDQLVKTRNELTLKIDSHFKKKKIAKINNNRKYIGKCYKDHESNGPHYLYEGYWSCDE